MSIYRVSRNFQIKKLRLKVYLKLVKKLAPWFDDLKIKHTHREENKHVDALVNLESPLVPQLKQSP